jgi:predicted nucleic acid-binding protein
VTSVAGFVGSILLDTAVPLYATGKDSGLLEPCAAVMEAVVSGRLRAYASVEMIQEFVFHRLRRSGDRARSVADGRDLSEVVTVLDFDAAVLYSALELIDQLPSLRGRDAVHAATALIFGPPVIVSPDPAFDGVPGLRRLDPVELAAQLSR